MELQAMRARRRERDEALIDELFKAAVGRAQKDQAENKIYGAFLEYSALAEDFKTLRNVSSCETKAAQLKNSKEVRQALKDEREIEVRRRSCEQEFNALIASASDYGEGVTATAQIKTLIEKYRRASKASEPSLERPPARCLLVSFFVLCSEQGGAALASKDYSARRGALLDCRRDSTRQRARPLSACARLCFEEG
jgi:hypothetical protein